MANKHKYKDDDAFIRQMMADDDSVSSKEAENIESFMQAMDAWDEDDMSPNPAVKKQLLADFKAQHSKDRLVWLNSFWLLLWPKDKSWYQTPGVQMLSMATIVVIAIFVFNGMDKDLEKTNNLAENETSEKSVEQVQDEKRLEDVKSNDIQTSAKKQETSVDEEDAVKHLETAEEQPVETIDGLKSEVEDLLVLDQAESAKDMSNENMPSGDALAGGLPKTSSGIADNRDKALAPAPAEGYSFNDTDDEKSDDFSSFNDADMAFGNGDFNHADSELSKNDATERSNKKSVDRKEVTSDITVVNAETVSEELSDEMEKTVTFNSANTYSGDINTTSVATSGSIAYTAKVNSVKATEDADLFDYLYTAE